MQLKAQYSIAPRLQLPNPQSSTTADTSSSSNLSNNAIKRTPNSCWSEQNETQLQEMLQQLKENYLKRNQEETTISTALTSFQSGIRSETPITTPQQIIQKNAAHKQTRKGKQRNQQTLSIQKHDQVPEEMHWFCTKFIIKINELDYFKSNKSPFKTTLQQFFVIYVLWRGAFDSQATLHHKVIVFRKSHDFFIVLSKQQNFSYLRDISEEANKIFDQSSTNTLNENFLQSIQSIIINKIDKTSTSTKQFKIDDIFSELYTKICKNDQQATPTIIFNAMTEITNINEKTANEINKYSTDENQQARNDLHKMIKYFNVNTTPSEEFLKWFSGKNFRGISIKQLINDDTFRKSVYPTLSQLDQNANEYLKTFGSLENDEACNSEILVDFKKQMIFLLNQASFCQALLKAKEEYSTCCKKIIELKNSIQSKMIQKFRPETKKQEETTSAKQPITNNNPKKQLIYTAQTNDGWQNKQTTIPPTNNNLEQLKNDICNRFFDPSCYNAFLTKHVNIKTEDLKNRAQQETGAASSYYNLENALFALQNILDVVDLPEYGGPNCLKMKDEVFRHGQAVGRLAHHQGINPETGKHEFYIEKKVLRSKVSLWRRSVDDPWLITHVQLVARKH